MRDLRPNKPMQTDDRFAIAADWQRRWADRPHSNGMATQREEFAESEKCPSCGAAIHFGLRHRHSDGPGRSGRWLGFVSGPLGLVTAGYVYMYGGVALSGYGSAVACLSGVMMWLVLSQIAERCPRSKRLHCKSCGWQDEIDGG